MMKFSPENKASFEQEPVRERLLVISIEEFHERFTLNPEMCRARVQAYKVKNAHEPLLKWLPIEDRFRGLVKLSSPGEGQVLPDTYVPMDVFLTEDVRLDGVHYPEEEGVAVLTEAVFDEKRFGQPTVSDDFPEPQRYLVKIKIPASFQERHGIVCDGVCQTREEALANPLYRDDASVFWDPEVQSEEYSACLRRIVEAQIGQGVLQIPLMNETLSEGASPQERAKAVHRRATELLRGVQDPTHLNEALAKLTKFADECF